jgi:hypothetical protein
MQRKFRIGFGFALSDNRKSKACTEVSRSIQNRKWAVLFAIVLALAVCAARVEAQKPKKVYRLGYLSNADAATDSDRVEGIRLAAMWMSSH